MLSPFHPLQLVLGLVVWAAYFMVVYALLSIACVHGAPPPAEGALTWINHVLLAITLAVAAALLWQALRGWRLCTPPDTSRFINRVGVAVYLVAAAATVGIGLPALILTPCL